MRREIVEQMVQSITDTGLFNKIYKNFMPVWTDVPDFPAAAVMYESEKLMREFISGNTFRYEATVIVTIYNKQDSTEYDDILTDLIDAVQRGILSNEWLVCNTIDCFQETMQRDGGALHPFAMAQLEFKVRYMYKA